MIQLAPMIFGLPVNASIFRFNAIWPVLMPTQGQAPETPLKRKFTALLNVLAESFRIDVNLMLLAAKCRLKQNLQHHVDSHSKRQQNKPVAFNRATGFDSPTVRQTAAINSLLSGNFYSVCISPSFTFSNGKQGREALRLLVRTASLSTRLLFPAYTFDSVTAGLNNPVRKGNTMTQIRKGYSRPLISKKIRSFATLAEAGRFIDRLTEANRNDYAFNIIQQDNRWTVCSVVSGGVQ